MLPTCKTPYNGVRSLNRQTVIHFLREFGIHFWEGVPYYGDRHSATAEL
jgi:hypothetical protein